MIKTTSFTSHKLHDDPEEGDAQQVAALSPLLFWTILAGRGMPRKTTAMTVPISGR
jgi:hypothetical protein